MMSNLWPLLKVQWKMAVRGTVENMTKTRSRWGLLLLPLILLGFVPLIVMITAAWAGFFVVLNLMGEGHVMLTLALTAGQLACLVFGILYVISAFYFAKDLRLLVPLPIRPGEIVVAKFCSVLVGEYLTMAPFVIPALAVYGVMADVSLLYIPLALLVYLMLPVIPLVLASLFSFVLMRVTNLRRNRDFLRVFGALLGVGLALLFQFWGQFSQGEISQGAFEELVTSQQPLIQAVSRWAITSVWATNALREDAFGLGLPSFLLFAAAVAVAAVLLILGAERLFFGGLLGGDEARSSGRRLSREELTSETGRVRSPLWALFMREVRLLNRTPSFLMAGVLPPLLMPLFMIFPLRAQGGPLENAHALSQYGDSPWVPLIVLGALLFLNSMSALPSSAISREGRWFWISRSLPVSPSLQVQAKLLHSLLFSLINLVLVLGFMLWLGLATPVNIAAVVLGGILAGVVTSYSGLLIDVMRPHLDWTDPQHAMKGNYNSLFAMGINIVLGAVTAIVTALLWALARPLLLPGLLILLAVEGWALGKATTALAERRYMEYEY